MTGPAMLRVQAAGPSSTIQDAGRFGFQRFGVSTAGAADPLLFAAANALVGNALDQGAIEFTFAGDSLAVEAESCRLAVAGDAAVAIDGRPVAAWTSHVLGRGQVLQVGALRSGLRGYVAVAGGFALAPVLGSVATHRRSAIGGLSGAPLRRGDGLPLGLDEAAAQPTERRLDPAPFLSRAEELRVVLGPQQDYFAADAIETFLSSAYRITQEADRMGYRLDGPRIGHARGFNITSDGIPLGAVQVPGTGQPIVLLADRQTAGGYPKIACVITPDVAALAQRRPGEAVRFRAIDPDAARRAHLAFRAQIAGLPALLLPARKGGIYDSETLLATNLVSGMVNALARDAGPALNG